jgi:hypothetical protein
MTDYTQLPIGTKIDDGVAEICPHCKRVGVAIVNNGVKVWNHRKGDIRDKDGLQFIADWCPKNLPGGIKPKPKDISD